MSGQSTLQRNSLAGYLTALADTAPRAQEFLDNGSPGTTNGSASSPGLMLASLRVEFAWVLAESVRQEGELSVGLPGLPLNPAMAALNARAAESACRISFEVRQSPVTPASSMEGEDHG